MEEAPVTLSGFQGGPPKTIGKLDNWQTQDSISICNSFSFCFVLISGYPESTVISKPLLRQQMSQLIFHGGLSIVVLKCLQNGQNLR